MHCIAYENDYIHACVKINTITIYTQKLKNVINNMFQKCLIILLIGWCWYIITQTSVIKHL